MFALMPWRREAKAGTLVPRPTDLFRDFETLFDRFFAPMPRVETAELPRLWGLEMEEAEKEYLVRAELPGFDPEEIEVTLAGDVLKIEAEHKEEVEGKEKEEMKERRYASVKRTVTLPQDVDVDRLEGTYRNGVLEIRIPRTPEAEARRIEIKA
jgi:HSP20 family protein